MNAQEEFLNSREEIEHDLRNSGIAFDSFELLELPPVYFKALTSLSEELGNIHFFNAACMFYNKFHENETPIAKDVEKHVFYLLICLLEDMIFPMFHDSLYEKMDIESLVAKAFSQVVVCLETDPSGEEIGELYSYIKGILDA